jgi:hypothetical protein
VIKEMEKVPHDGTIVQLFPYRICPNRRSYKFFNDIVSEKPLESTGCFNEAHHCADRDSNRRSWVYNAVKTYRTTSSLVRFRTKNIIVDFAKTLYVA